MQTITLQVENSVYKKLFSLLAKFSKNEISILDQSEYISDDEYLRSIDGMVESIKSAREEPIENGVGIDKLQW